MGLIADEIRELRQMLKDVDSGKLTIEKGRLKLGILKESHKLGILKESHKRAKFYLDIYTACNAPHLVEKRMHSLALVSKGELVQSPAEIELEMIMCPDNDKAIAREACLDFSGDSKNLKNCQSCEHFGITRKMLSKEQ